MFARPKAILKQLHQDESGAMSVEKILIIAFISVPLIIALYMFRNLILGWFQGKSDDLKKDINTDLPYTG